METVTVREVQHNLARILRRVESGAEILIRRRRTPVARLLPLERPAEQAVDWSSHEAEIAAVFGGRTVTGIPMERLVSEARGEH